MQPAVGCVYTPGNAGAICRASAGVCDAAETCTGSAAACPANQLQPATFTCRAASSACDSPELCTGTDTSCPATSDKLGPTLLPGTDQTVLGNCSFLSGNVSYVFPTELNAASGQCDAPANVKCTTIAANSFGPHTVSCTAKDSIGNVSNTVAFTVTVLEPLSVSLQSSLAGPPSNNIARVGWTVLHSVKLLNCSSSDVTATVAAGVKLTTSLQNGLAIGTKRLSASTATPDANGAFVRVGSGAAATFQYKLGDDRYADYRSGGLLDTKYWLSTMTASYTAAPTLTAGSTDGASRDHTLTRTRRRHRATQPEEEVPPWINIPSWLAKIDKREAKIGVIGLGYVGLPLSLAFVEKGFSVLGFDLDPQKIAKLNVGKSYIQGVADARVRAGVEETRFSASDDLRGSMHVTPSSSACRRR